MTDADLYTDAEPDDDFDSAAEPDPNLYAAGDWRAALEPDERSFAEQFASPADAVRAALEFRRKLSTSVPLPGPDDSPERRLELLNRLGRPDSVDGYDVTPPDSLPDWLSPDDESLQDAQHSFLEAMHGAGATQDMVDAALGWYWNRMAETEAERNRRQDEDYAAAEAGLRRDWGRDYDRNIEHAGRAIAAFGGDDLGTALEKYGLAGHPAVIRAFARIGRSMGEDDMITGRLSETTKDQLRQRAEALVAEEDYWTSEASQREMREIMLQLYGSAEIGPGAGQ